MHQAISSLIAAESLRRICSLISTAKLNNVEPFTDLEDVLERMSKGHHMSRLIERGHEE